MEEMAMRLWDKVKEAIEQSEGREIGPEDVARIEVVDVKDKTDIITFDKVSVIDFEYELNFFEGAN